MASRASASTAQNPLDLAYAARSGIHLVCLLRQTWEKGGPCSGTIDKHRESEILDLSRRFCFGPFFPKIEATTTAECVRSARLRLMDVQIYRTAPWRATAVFAGAERDDDDDDDGLAWGEVISYEPSPDQADVPVAVPIPSAPPAEAVRA